MRPHLDKARQSLRSDELLFADYGDGVQHREEAELAVVQARDFVSACVALIEDKKTP